MILKMDRVVVDIKCYKCSGKWYQPESYDRVCIEVPCDIGKQLDATKGVVVDKDNG